MQRKNAKASAEDFFDANARNFVKFGKAFISNITDEKLVSELAHKDLEKLAKVFKLVFELIGEISPDKSADKAAELIAAYSALREEDER